MHLEAPWGDPHHTVWSWGHPAQQAACQRPSVSHGEGEAPQGSPFPQHWISLGVLRHSITSTRDGVGVVSTWLLWRASAALLPAQGITSFCRHGGTSAPPYWCQLVPQGAGQDLQGSSQQRECAKREKGQKLSCHL